MHMAAIEPEVSRHKCLIYEGHPSTQLPVVAPLLIEGLQDKQLEAFSYSVSHDLRSPLTSILGFADLIQEEHGEALGERGRERLAHINLSGRRMAELIEALLALARLANADVRRSSVDLTALAWEVSA